RTSEREPVPDEAVETGDADQAEQRRRGEAAVIAQRTHALQQHDQRGEQQHAERVTHRAHGERVHDRQNAFGERKERHPAQDRHRDPAEAFEKVRMRAQAAAGCDARRSASIALSSVRRKCASGASATMPLMRKSGSASSTSCCPSMMNLSSWKPAIMLWLSD